MATQIFGADNRGQENYAAGSANLEARAGLWSYAIGGGTGRTDWFCDLVDWNGVRLAGDIGCGSGRYIDTLARRSDRVIALDVSSAMVREVAAKSSVPVMVGDVCQLPLHDGALDRSLAAWMLYHAADANQACAELRRAVRPDGALIAVTNAAAHTAELDGIFAEASEGLLGKSEHRPRLPANGFTLDDAAAQLSRHFSTVTIHVHRVQVGVPTPTPVVAYFASLRSYMDELLAVHGASFDDLVPHLQGNDRARAMYERRGWQLISGATLTYLGANEIRYERDL